VKIYTFSEGQPDRFCTFSGGQRGRKAVFGVISATANPQKSPKMGSFADLAGFRGRFLGRGNALSAKKFAKNLTPFAPEYYFSRDRWGDPPEPA